MSTALATRVAGNNGSPAVGHQANGIVPSIIETMDALKAIRTFISEEFVDGTDFGVIPGTGKVKGKDGKDHERKVLLLPGAQKACMYFNCYPDTEERPTELGNGHVEYLVKSTLISRTTGMKVGMGTGSCTTMESKYRFRNANRLCPKCGKDAVFTSKNEGEGYYCWKKKDGCGMTFRKGDPEIEGQVAGKVENDNPYDLRNTVLKIAVKRATVAAALGLGCLTEMFTQDLDDTYDIAGIQDTTRTAREQEKVEEAPPAPRSQRKATGDPNPTQTSRKTGESRSEPRKTPESTTKPGTPQQDRPGRDAQADADQRKRLIKWAEQQVAEANAWWKEPGNPGLLVANHWQLIRAIGRAAHDSGEIADIKGLEPGTIAGMLAKLDPRKVKATAEKYLYEDKPAKLACAANAPQGREMGED